MDSTYAFLVEYPRLFPGKKIVLAASLKAALDWVEAYRAEHFKDCREQATSIVCVGEVVNPYGG